jgi:uncharacterized protein (TIGR03435 family)
MSRSVLVLALLAGHAIAFAQPKPSFEVASIKPAAPCCAPGQWRESKAGDDRIDFRYVTLRYCIAFAYGLKEYQVSGPPAIAELRYDIVAKAPEGTKHEQLPGLMQALLADRFKLELHREQKEFSVYTLVVGKGGPKLKESPATSDPTAGGTFGISMTGPGVGRMEVRHADMQALANTLPRFVGRPVVNRTGLEGRYDFDLEFSPEDLRGMPAPPNQAGAVPAAELGVSIFTSIQRVGLKLESQKQPLNAIVVDKVEKVASEN